MLVAASSSKQPKQDLINNLSDDERMADLLAQIMASDNDSKPRKSVVMCGLGHLNREAIKLGKTNIRNRLREHGLRVATIPVYAKRSQRASEAVMFMEQIYLSDAIAEEPQPRDRIDRPRFWGPRRRADA